MGNNLKILFSGVIEKPWQSGVQRLTALEQLGHQIIRVSSTVAQSESRYFAYTRRFMPAAIYERLLASHEAQMHQLLTDAAEAGKPDVIWLEWPRMVGKRTLVALKKKLPGVPIISYQDDNPFGPRRFADYGWRRFFDAMPAYDAHLVKRESDVKEYSKRGAKNVQVFLTGYPEDLFYPETNGDPSMTHDVMFVGTALDQRVSVLDELTGKLGVPVDIYGARWDRTPLFADRKHLLHGSLSDDGYRQTVSNSKISLGFVSHSNLDRYTARLFEVPACGTLFLGEATEKQMSLFEPDKEAAFFASTEECRDKIKYYLAHDDERNRIAEAGRVRATENFGFRKRMAEAVEFMEKLR